MRILEDRRNKRNDLLEIRSHTEGAFNSFSAIKFQPEKLDSNILLENYTLWK